MEHDAPSADSLIQENAELRRRLDSALHAGDMERARMAALVEACDAVAQFVATYTPDSALARVMPTFYGIFRVYGLNARAAVAAVRPQADALLAERQALIDLNMRYVACLQAAYHALMAYGYGNAAPDLAQATAAHILATMEEASEG